MIGLVSAFNSMRHSFVEASTHLHLFLTTDSSTRALQALRELTAREDIYGKFAQALLETDAEQLLSVGQEAEEANLPSVAAYAFFYALPFVDAKKKQQAWQRALEASRRAKLLHLIALLWSYYAYREGPRAVARLLQEAAPEVRAKPFLELLSTAEAAFWCNGELVKRLHTLLEKPVEAVLTLERGASAFAQGLAYLVLGRFEWRHLDRADEAFTRAEQLFDAAQAPFFAARAATYHAICLRLKLPHAVQLQDKISLIRRMQEICRSSIRKLKPACENLALSILQGNLATAIADEALYAPRTSTRIRLLSASADAIYKALELLPEDQVVRRGLNLLNLSKVLVDRASLTFERHKVLRLLQEARQAVEQAFEILSKTGQTRIAAVAAENLSGCLGAIAEYDFQQAEEAARRSLFYAERAIELAKQCGDEVTAVDTQQNKGAMLLVLATLHQDSEKLRQAVDVLEEVARVQQRYNPRLCASTYLWLERGYALLFAHTSEPRYLREAQKASESAAFLYETTFDFCNSFYRLLSAVKYAVLSGIPLYHALNRVKASLQRLFEVLPEEEAIYQDLQTLVSAYQRTYEGWSNRDEATLKEVSEMLEGLRVCLWREGVLFVRTLIGLLRDEERERQRVMSQIVSAANWIDVRIPYTFAWQAKAILEGGTPDVVFLEPPYGVLAPIYTDLSLLLQTAYQAYQAVEAASRGAEARRATLAEIRQYVEEIRHLYSATQ